MNQFTPTPRHFWHTLETTASAEEIWRAWTDVEHWHEWDKGLKAASLQGAFQPGAKGTLVSLNGTTSQFVISDHQEGKSYTFKTSLPLASLSVKRFLHEKGGVTSFTHEVWFDGLLGRVFALLLGKNFMSILPSVMGNVRRIAEGTASKRETLSML
jgi:hypothetical protein